MNMCMYDLYSVSGFIGAKKRRVAVLLNAKL